LERLAKVILYGTLATTVPFNNISTLCSRNKKQIYNFSEAQRAAAWPPLLHAIAELNRASHCIVVTSDYFEVSAVFNCYDVVSQSLSVS